MPSVNTYVIWKWSSLSQSNKVFQKALYAESLIDHKIGCKCDVSFLCIYMNVWCAGYTILLDFSRVSHSTFGLLVKAMHDCSQRTCDDIWMFFAHSVYTTMAHKYSILKNIFYFILFYMQTTHVCIVFIARSIMKSLLW